MRGWEACWLESWLAWLFSRCWTNEVLPVPGGGWRGGQHTQGGCMHDIVQLHIHGGLHARTQLHIHPCTLLPITCAQVMDRDKQTGRQADRQAGRQTDRQAGRQAGRQAVSHPPVPGTVSAAWSHCTACTGPRMPSDPRRG